MKILPFPSLLVFAFSVGLSFQKPVFAEVHIAFSRVGEMTTQSYPIAEESSENLIIIGDQADAFRIRKIDGGGRVIDFMPSQGRGIYVAQVVTMGDDEPLYSLHGLATDKLEGKNEPPLNSILTVFGISLDPGGTQLMLNTKSETIGDSIPASEFRVAEGADEISVTLLARYSPKGEAEIGFAVDGGESLQTFGHMANSSRLVPDAHQRIYPPAKNEEASFLGAANYRIPASECPDRFGFYFTGKHFAALTYPGKAKGAKIKHTARVYPVGKIAGRELKNAYLICFEEAKNGDYQDAVLLVEGIAPAGE
ncbi:MAG: hypothetical protein AAGJ81_06875 [Verrucomicrobiota bacterium]